MPESADNAAWDAALAAFDQDLARRAVAEKTRTAYASDVRDFAVWATDRAMDPADVDVRALRRYAAGLSERGAAPATIARRLAALRGLFRVQMELGAREDNPAELLSSPKKAQRLPRVLKASEVAALLDSIPAATPLDLRDRALFELAYACGLRAEELVNLDFDSVDFDSESVRVEGKGGKTRLVPVGEHALGALERYLARGRGALTVEETCSGTPETCTGLQVTPVLSANLGAFSQAMGAAQLLPDNNYFFLAPFVPFSPTVTGSSSIEILPTAGTDTGTQVFNLSGLLSYRAWRMANLYQPPTT